MSTTYELPAGQSDISAESVVEITDMIEKIADPNVDQIDGVIAERCAAIAAFADAWDADSCHPADDVTKAERGAAIVAELAEALGTAEKVARNFVKIAAAVEKVVSSYPAAASMFDAAIPGLTHAAEQVAAVVEQNADDAERAIGAIATRLVVAIAKRITPEQVVTAEQAAISRSYAKIVADYKPIIDSAQAHVRASAEQAAAAVERVTALVQSPGGVAPPTGAPEEV